MSLTEFWAVSEAPSQDPTMAVYGRVPWFPVEGSGDPACTQPCGMLQNKTKGLHHSSATPIMQQPPL